MFGGLDDPDDDEGSIWDTGGIDLFGSSTSNGVTRVLSSSDCTVEELMRQDEFIQETQGRNSRLMALLSSPEGMDTLLYYLTTPQHPRNEDRAFRFPYMASEALCCKVDELLDAVVGVGKEGQEGRDAALCALFSLPAPGLRGSGGGGSGGGTTPTHEDEVPRGTEDPFQLSQGIPHGTGFRSYLLGYWCKAVGVVCKTRPGPLLRFLDASPGIAAGLVPLLGNPSVAATLHASLLALPWAPPCALLATPHMTLAQGDPPHQGLPELLLGALEAGLLACSSGGGGGGPGPGPALAIAEGAASVLCALLTTSRASAPHSKFAEDGYNERRIAAALAIKLASTPPTLPPSVDPVAAATAALIAGPSAAELRGALDSENLALDSNFYSLEHRVEDSIHLRLFKVLRDDPHYVARVVGILGLALGVVGTGKEGATSFTSQSAASHVFRVVACLVEVLGEGWWESVEECLRGDGGGGDGGGGEATTVSPRTPLLITQLSASGGMVERLSRHLLAECGRARGGAAPASAPASASASASAPGACAAPHPSSPNAPKLGLSGGLAVRLLVALTKCGWAECTMACSSAKAYTTLLSCMDSFPWHSVVHSAVAGGIITALSRVQTVCDRGSEGVGWVGGGSGNGGSSGAGAGSGGSSGSSGGGGGGGGGGAGMCAWGSQSLSSSIESLIVGSDLPQWVSDKVGVMAWPLALTSPKAPTLVGYGGHLLNTTNALLSAFASNALAALSPPSAHHVAGHTRFWTAVDGPIAVANVAHGVMLGGKLPPDVKASGVVGQNADAAPAPKGKAGSGGGGGEGGGGSGRDQGEEDEEKEWGEDEERKEAEDRAKRLAKLMRNSAAATIGDYDDDDDDGLEDEDEEEEEEEEKEKELEEKKRKGEESTEDSGGGHWDGFSAGGETLTISGSGVSSSSTTTGSSFDDPFGDMDFGAAATSTTTTSPATVITEDWGAF